VNIFASLVDWFRDKVASNKLRGHEFGVIRFGPSELPMVPFKHPHIGKVKLFYVDSKVRDKLAGVDNAST
jgi:hypothetical protein